MTSTNDGKEVKSYQTSGTKGKTYFIELYKSLESRLSEAVTASERTKHLCEAWRRVHSLCQHSAPTTHPHLLSWLQRHTARAVLQTKWPSPERKDDRRHLEDAINVFIDETNVAAASREEGSPQWEAQLVARGEWFKKVLEHPWKHPVLNCLLNPDGTPPTDDDVLEWLKEERGVTFVMRLHTLVSEKCDDIAMSLATAVMERVRGDAVTSDVDQSGDHKEKPDQTLSNFAQRLQEEAGFTVDVWEMLTDIEFVLLHKRDSSRCITLAKQTPIRTAYQLIERLQSRLETSPREKRLWKNSKEVAVLIAQVVITRCMVIPQCTGGSRSALYCCARSLARLMASARLPAAARALAAPAPTAAHLHTLAAAIDAQLAQKNEVGMKPFVCELYVRAITAGMNELERLKLKTEEDLEARSMEQTIASWFVQLGAVLSSSDRVKCECALTAFSVHPSPQMYERIKAAPSLPPIPIPDVEESSADANPEFGSWASDSRSQTNFVKTSETLNMKARQNQANVLSTAILTEGEALGLSPELCQDITVLLSGPRVKTLSWDMDRELLLENCRAYLERTHGGTKAVTTELKYLNLDPADFQYLPEEDDDENNIYYGIEKGYEHLVEFQEPEDIWEDAYDKADTAYLDKAESSYSSDEFDFIQPQRRRKTKKPTSKSDEDDPLSLVAETKRKEKKERPHSKERSKEKKKAIDPVENKEQGDPLELANQEPKKEKPKRERKKKPPKPTDGSLANLVGLKVGKSAKSAKILVHESDADSQGHSSVRSMNSDDNVLYDGVFSMDDMRSPRSSLSSDSIGLMQTNEASRQMGNNLKTKFNRSYRPASVSGVRIASPSPSKSQSPSDRSRNDSPTHISDDIRGSLTKLLEYRRQKAFEDQRRKPNAIIRPDGSMAMDKINISPKGVAIPEIPKSYISKQSDNMTMLKQMDHSLNQRKPSTAIPSPVIQYASKQFSSPDKPSQSHYSPRTVQHNNVQAERVAPSDRRFSTPPPAGKFLDSVNLISIYDKFEPTHSRNNFDKSSYPDIPQDNQRRSNVDTSYINYKDHVHEFSLNAYNQYMENKDASKKVTSSISSMPSPMVPNKKPELSAKQMPQKPDGSLNTFARMSYYKNKQTDTRKSQDMPLPCQPQTVGAKLDGFIMDHLLNSQKSAKPQANVQTPMRQNTETPQTTSKDHPMLSNILLGNSLQMHNHHKKTPPPKSALSEKDQNDLLLLLRQQNALNKPQNIPAATCSKSHTTLNSPVACNSKSVTVSTGVIYDSNTSLVPPSFMPNPQSGKPNEALNKITEGKMINVLSTSILKTADIKPNNPKPKPANTKKPIEDKPKKTKNRAPKKIAPKPEPRRNPEEWENVMNAILKQKTPCRGPNALDMALNKSSFEKAFEESLRRPPCLFTSPNAGLAKSTIISQTESFHEEFVNITKSCATAFSSQTVTKTQKTTYSPLKIPHRESLLKKNSKTKKPGKTPLNVTTTVETLIRQQKIEEKTIERLMKNNNIEITKHTSSITLLEIPERTHKHRNDEKPVKVVQQRHVETSKINVRQNHAERFKNTVRLNHEETKKHVNYSELKQDNPFMPGIPNSDYDLLDELMDDDLRKEIGELSSDEETYHVQDFLKDSKLNQNRVQVAYNEVNDNSSMVPITNMCQPICKQNQMPPSTTRNPSERPQSKEPVLVTIAPAGPVQNKLGVSLKASNVQKDSTHVITQSTQARACNSASLIRSTQIPVEANMYITVPCPAPVQNVMLTPELVYENYPSVTNSTQAVPNIAPSTFINNVSNVSVYPSTQFVAPTATPVIITTAVINTDKITTVQPKPAIKVSEYGYCISSSELRQPSHLATAQGNIIVDGNKLVAKTKSSLPNVADRDMMQKTKISAGENEGKGADRKVLKEVQEKHADEKIDCKRSQKVTPKDLKTQADQERLKNKRIAILNRKISSFCGIETIALGYSPLQISTLKKDDHVVAKTDTENDLRRSNENNEYDGSNEINSPATPDSYKENKIEPTQVRRILLRSSNKLKSKTSGTSSLKPSLDQTLKTSTSNSTNTPNETSSQNEQSDLEMNDKQKRVSKRIRNKSVTTPKDAKNNETELQIEVKKKITVALKVSKKKVKDTSSKIENPISNKDFEKKQVLDVETELLGSTIEKVRPTNLDIPDPPLEITSLVNIDEKIKETLIPDKGPIKSLDIQKDKHLQSLSVNEITKPSEQGDLYKESIRPVDIEHHKISVKVYDSATSQHTQDLINGVLGETKAQENKKVDIQEKDKNDNDNVKETISSIEHSLQPNNVCMNKTDTLIQDGSPDTDMTSEVSPNEFVNIPIPREKDTNVNKNYLENGAKDNSAHTNHSNDKIFCQSQKTHNTVDLRKISKTITPQSQVVDDDDDDIEIVEENPINSLKAKDVQSKPSPDSIVIEHITSAYDNNPLKKLVRIKLGNGKVFKGTISGSVNITDLLEDPSVKAMLMSQFEQPKKLYSLRLNVNKNFLHGSPILSTQVQEKSKPQLPMETVSLLSDDEEDDPPKTFETEYGKHKIAPMDACIFKKHQKKLLVKSYVSVKKLTLAEENAIKRRSGAKHKVNTNRQVLKECVVLDDIESTSICSKKLDDTKILTAIPSKYVQGVIDDVEAPPVCSKKLGDTKILSTIPSKYVQGVFADIDNILAPAYSDPKEEQIVLIDDSSNDSMDVKNKPETNGKIDELKNMLLKDLGVETFLTSNNEATDEVQVTWDSEAIDLTDDLDLEKTDHGAKVNPDLEITEHRAQVDPALEVIDDRAQVDPDLEVIDYRAQVDPDMEVIDDRSPVDPDLEITDDGAQVGPDIKITDDGAQMDPDLKIIGHEAQGDLDLKITGHGAQIDKDLKMTDRKAQVKKNYQKIMQRKCFVKLVRCDEQPKCQPISVLWDEFESKNDEIIPAPLSRSGSFSILEELPKVLEFNKNTVENEQSRSSPVMEVYDLISSLDRTSTKPNISDLAEVRVKCCTEWMTTKRDKHLQSINVTIKHLVPQSLVVPQLSVLVLSYIQKEDLVSKTSFHSSLIPLKRKTVPSSPPGGKISKLDNLANVPHSNLSTSMLDLSVSHATNVPNEIDDEIEAAIKTKEVLEAEDQKIINDVETSDLSDTDVTSMTVSDFSDNDDTNMTLINRGMEFEDNQEAHTGKNIVLNKTLDFDRGSAVFFQTDNETEFDGKVVGSQNKYIIDSSPYLSTSSIADSSKEHSPRKIIKETAAEFPINLVDDIPSDFDLMKQIEETDVVQTDLGQAFIDENNTYEFELGIKVAENQKESFIDSLVIITDDISKNSSITDSSKEHSPRKIIKETAAEFPINLVDDIPSDFDLMKQIEETDVVQTDLGQASIDENNTYEFELGIKVGENQKESFIDSLVIITDDISKNSSITDSSKEHSPGKIIKETAAEFPINLVDDIPIDLDFMKDIEETDVLQTDLGQASKDENNTYESELGIKVAENQKESFVDSLVVITDDISKNSTVYFTKEHSPQPVFIHTHLVEASIDVNNTVCLSHDNRKIYSIKETDSQNKSMIDSLDVNSDLTKKCVVLFPKEHLSTATSEKSPIDNTSFDLDMLQIEEPVQIKTDQIQTHSKEISVKLLIGDIPIDLDMEKIKEPVLTKVLTESEETSAKLPRDDIPIDLDMKQIEEPVLIKVDRLQTQSEETSAKLLNDDISIDLDMNQIEESVSIKVDPLQTQSREISKETATDMEEPALIKNDLLHAHKEDGKNVINPGIFHDTRDYSIDNSDIPLVGVTGDQVINTCQSKIPALKICEVDVNLEIVTNSKYIADKIEDSKGLFIVKKEGNDFDVINTSIALEIPLQNTTGYPNIEDYMRESLVHREGSDICIGVDNQLMAQSTFSKKYSSEKTVLEATIPKIYASIFTNSPSETSGKQKSESNFETQISNMYDMPEYQELDMQEPKNIESTKITSEEALSHKSQENENSEHNLSQCDQHSQATQEHHSISKVTNFPRTNDEIFDALNQMFEEKFDTTACCDNKTSANKQHTYCKDRRQNGTIDENIEPIASLKISEEVRIDNTVTKVEKAIECHMADLPKTTEEIVIALKKMFGESDDSLDISEGVVNKNLENVSSGKTPIVPNHKNLAVKDSIEHHDDAINVSLRNGLSLIEEPDCDTVVEGIVDMLSEDIIGDITVATLNCKEHDVNFVEKENIIEESIIADTDTLNNVICDTRDDNALNSLSNYLEQNGQTGIKDIEYPKIIGPCHEFSVMKELVEINKNGSRIKEPTENIDLELYNREIDEMKLIIPQLSYSYSKNSDQIIRKSFRNMKRKKDMSDIKTVEKKYRKGKNIDYPKSTASAIADLAYAKEYKRIIDYCSTIKFSYARPFHIECIDVNDMLKAWPITEYAVSEVNDSNNAQDMLYRDTEDTENAKVITDPLNQTLNEEIVNGENIDNYESIDINETNFNMGFGERSGRVIQKIETGITKLSAATLSDVKQYQPFSMSEVNKEYFARKIDTQNFELSNVTNLINLKDKVRSFFKKTELELTSELLLNKKYAVSDRHLSEFAFGLTSSEFMEVPSMEPVVNVMQVGQLPVSAAVQNSATCDPRVTQVSDASPSQCSDNSAGDDTHSTVETEYTELTTANITLPLVQEYTHNHQQSPHSRDQNSLETHDEPNESFSIVKIELMEETSQENLENDIYDNDFSPLPNNNVEYSFEDTSNTLFNTSVSLNNISKADNASNNTFDTTSTMGNNFTNIMFDHTTNMDSAYSIENTPSSTESTYTNMDNASCSMYSTSPNMGISSTELDDTVNTTQASNMETTNMDDTSANNTYSNVYNPMGSDSNDVDNVTSNINETPIDLEIRHTDMNNASNIENGTYDYTYENIEDYAANNNDNYVAEVDHFGVVENYSTNVDDYASNVENFVSNDESYSAGVEKYASNIENYATHIENYSSNVENYTNNVDNTDSSIDNNLTNMHDSTSNILEEPQDLSMANSSLEPKSCGTFKGNDTSKTNQIEHAMDAAGIAAESVITSGADELANLITQSAQQQSAASNSFSKSTPINVMTLQQALAHVIPPPLNQTGTSDNSVSKNPVSQQVLHIVQGNHAQTVINKPNGTHLLHIVQNKNNLASNGLSLVDAGLQQGGNQLIHIVNNGNQNNAQFLKRVNLFSNLTNAQGSNEQKMIQLVCKSADGKSIQLNTGHQRSMVLRLHPTTVQATPKPTEPQDLSTASSGANPENGQDPSQDIKSRSVYEENYAQFIQNSGSTPGSSSTTPCQEKATSLPKFDQVFGKPSYQENQNEINSGLQENSDCSPEENNAHIEQAPEVNSPRNASTEATQAQPSPAQQIKQTPMNIHTTMHGGVIYTRQIPVNIGGRKTINLITVPTTELEDDSLQKQHLDSNFEGQEGEQSSIIKLVPHHTSSNNVSPEEKNTQANASNETNHNATQPQPVLTQMRIKLPMLSKGHHIVPGARLVRPSFFQIQRNVIAGTNQPVYQQLVLTTAPPLGQTIRLPNQSPQGPPLLVQTSQHPQSSPHIPVQQVQHAPSSQHVTVQQTQSATRTPQPHAGPPELTKPDAVPESELSTLTLEQLREFDMVLEQVKERSVQPTPSTTPSAKPCTPADSTDDPALATTSVSESTQQVHYSVENSQPTNVVSYVNRKSTITSATTSFVRSPDSSGIVDSPSSSTQVQITHTVTSKSSTSDSGSAVVSQTKKKKKKKPSTSSSTMASLGSPSKTNVLKPQEDEQTTQRILYILAEYKEQVENSPDKNKPAPRRRNQFPPTVGSKRKRHCSSRSTCRREGSEPGEVADDLITLGSEDSSCGTTFSECMDCQEIHSPESPTKVVRRLTFEETTTQITQTQTSQIPQRNVIVGDRQTITVARTTTATTAKPTTTVLMPANYILPVSMLKGGQQIAIMTNRGPKILVGAGDNNTSALLIQRLITPGLKPVLTRPGVRHIRLPTTLHNLQAFNIQATPVTQAQPPDSTAPQASMPGPPDLIGLRSASSPWQDREGQDKPTRAPTPDCTEPWNLPSSSIADDYGYEEIVRTDNLERTVLDAIPDRYSPDMEAQRIFDKMFDVDSKKSMYDSSRCGYDMDTSDGDDKPYPQVVQQRKDGRHHRVTHVSTAALRHKYAILEHELRLQKSLSEECEDLGVDSPSASELFPEADILFGAPSPAHEQTIDQCSTPPSSPLLPQPELEEPVAADPPVVPPVPVPPRTDDLDLNLDGVGEIVTVGEDGIATIPIINAEEFAKSHPNTTFHTEPEDGEITPFTIAQNIKGRHITFHANRVPGTVVMAPQTTVISQATVNNNDPNTVKFIDIDNMINSMPCPQPAVQSVLVKDNGNSRPQSKLDSLKEPGTSGHKSNTKSDSLKNSGKSRTNSKIDSSKDLGTFAPRSKYDSLRDPGTSHRSKFDSHKDSAPGHKSSSKFDSLREPGVSTLRTGSKYDSLKDPSISNSRSSSKYDKELTGSRSYAKSDNQKDSGNLAPKPLSKFDSLLTESKLQLSSNSSGRQIVHSTGHGTQVIRRLRYDERTNTRTNNKFHFEEPRRRTSISDEMKMRNDRAMMESMGDNASSPGQPELFWDSTTTERHERRFHFSENEKVPKSPFDELLNDSSAYGPHTRLDSVIKAARPERTYERTSFEGMSISGSSDESRPLRTYPPKRVQTQQTQDTERHFTLKTTTTTTHHEVDRHVDRTTFKTTHHHEVDRTKKTRCQDSDGRRRTGRGLVKRGCSCCNGSQSAPPKKRSRPKKPPPEFPPTNKSDPLS